MRKVMKKINFYCTHVSAVTLAALMLLTVTDVFLRFAFNKPVPGAFEMTEILIPVMVLFAAAYAHNFGDHVVIDIIYVKLPKVARWIISLVSTLIYLAIVVLICWRIYIHSGNLRIIGAETSQLHIPHWPVLLIGSIGMLMFVVTLIADLIFIIKDRGVLGE